MRAAQATSQPLTNQQAQRERKRTQRAAQELLRERQTRYPELRMRKKLESWPLQLFPRLRAQRALAVLPRLAALAPPRVSAAVLRTWWSGWCTKKRFGSRGCCVFCGGEDVDSVKHASVCRVLAEFGRDHLLLQYHVELDARRLQFLLLEPPSRLDDRRLLLGALRIAAAYRVHCKFRRRSFAGGVKTFILQALAQATREALSGHASAGATFDARWAAARATCTAQQTVRNYCMLGDACGFGQPLSSTSGRTGRARGALRGPSLPPAAFAGTHGSFELGSFLPELEPAGGACWHSRAQHWKSQPDDLSGYGSDR